VRSLALLGVALLGLTLVGASLALPGAGWIGSQERMGWFVLVACVAGAVYAGAVWVVMHRRLPPWGVGAIVGFAVMLRLAVVAQPPFLSSDLFRYVWDGRVQLAGINPYRYIPADPALAGLRDAEIYPHINRAEYARTIYPPAAQMLFAAVAAVRQSPLAIKATMAGFDLLTIFVLLHLLTLVGRPAQRVLIYAWHPLPIWEFAGSGHVDAVAVAMIALAMLAFAGRRDGLAGAALAAAVLIKLLPAVLLPALWRNRNVPMLVVFVTIIVMAYVCYSSVGSGVFGFLSSYTAEEGLSSGGGLFAVFVAEHLLPLPTYAGKIYLLIVAGVLATIGLRALRSTQPAGVIGAAWYLLVLATVLTAALTPHYPWYFAWLLLPSCLVCRWSVIYLTIGAFLLYLDQAEHRMVWQSLLYAPFLACVLVETWRGRVRQAEDAFLLGRMN
jgi:hypothetical protein